MRKVKPGEPDVVTVQVGKHAISYWEYFLSLNYLYCIVFQDVKDLAIYTAPLTLMSPTLIDMLHLSTTERFIRTLIFYCQYYLQVCFMYFNEPPK